MSVSEVSPSRTLTTHVRVHQHAQALDTLSLNCLVLVRLCFSTTIGPKVSESVSAERRGKHPLIHSLRSDSPEECFERFQSFSFLEEVLSPRKFGGGESNAKSDEMLDK